MEIEDFCPLGCECEEIKNNKMRRCRWYVKLVGKDPQSKKEYDDWRCALVWNVITNIEISQTNRGQTQALESFRNETIKRQDTFASIALSNVVDNTSKALKNNLSNSMPQLLDIT